MCLNYYIAFNFDQIFVCFESVNEAHIIESRSKIFLVKDGNKSNLVSFGLDRILH